MKKINKFLAVGALVLLLLSSASTVQGDEFFNFTFGGAGDESTGVIYSDHYKFGSVKIDLSTQRNSYKGGERLVVNGILRNTNDYPVPDGGLHVQIFRRNDAYKTKAGSDLVTEFYAEKNITLNANSNKKLSFNWDIPENITGGRYLVAMDYIIDDQFYLSGSPILEGVYGGVSYFEIAGGRGDEVIFNKENIFVNEEKVYARDFLPNIEEGRAVSVKYQMNNLSSSSQDIKVTEKLYNWDGLREENLVATNIKDISLEAQERKDKTATFDNLDAGTYLLKVSTESEQGVPALLSVRFTVTGEVAPARINFQTLKNFPIKAGEPNEIFSSFHSVFYGASKDHSVKLALLDDRGNTISETNYSGDIQPGVTAIMESFTPNRDYNNVSLKTTIYDQNNNVVSETNTAYTPEKFANTPAALRATVKDNDLIIALTDVFGNEVDAQYALEIRNKDGRNLFFEPSQSGEFKKDIEELGLNKGENYDLIALALDDNMRITAEDINLEDLEKSGLDSTTLYIILFAILIVVLIIVKKLAKKKV